MDTLGTIGEKALVNEIVKNTHSGVALGPGDDAAAIKIGDQCIVISSDIMSKKTHTSEGMSYYDIGWFAAAVNYSDVAAMGAAPVGILVSLFMERDLEVSCFRELMRGVRECSEAVGGEILGGDTKEGAGIVISGTALGIVDEKKMLKRGGAKPGDLIAVTGPIGTAAAGFFAVQFNVDAPSVKKTLFTPFPRTKEGCILSDSGYVTACMDITDGLAYSINEISRHSGGVYFQVDWEKIPITEETKDVISKTNSDEIETVLYYGGEYELVFTFDPQGEEYLRRVLGDHFYIIGEAKGNDNIMIKNGKPIELEYRGWEHFKS